MADPYLAMHGRVESDRAAIGFRTVRVRQEGGRGCSIRALESGTTLSMAAISAPVTSEASLSTAAPLPIRAAAQHGVTRVAHPCKAQPDQRPIPVRAMQHQRYCEQ